VPGKVNWLSASRVGTAPLVCTHPVGGSERQFVPEGRK